VIITQLYIQELISAGAMMAGLLVGAGVGVLVLFRTNRPMWQNVKIVGLLYGISIAAGFLMDLLRITF
jgi:multisubunit Na+/H+ antiporter MnhE subunit